VSAFVVVRTDRRIFATRAAALADVTARNLEGRAIVVEVDASIGDRVESFVYVVQAGGPAGPVKIGWTADLKSRLATLATDNAAPISVLVVAPATMATEKALHAHFAPHRIRGVWYRPTSELIGFARSLAEADLAQGLARSVGHGPMTRKSGTKRPP
jgi:hypothetical protein